MKTLRARIAAILLVAVMGITLSGCNNEADVSSASSGAEVSDNGDADNSSDSNSDESSQAENNKDESSNENAGGNSESEPEESEEDLDDPNSFLQQDVTFTWGDGSSEDTEQDPTEPPTESVIVVTEYVAVTEAGGEAATDAKGEEVTEVVTETQVVTEPYIPAMDSFRSYWLDMVQNSDGTYNKTFGGEFLVVTFKIKDSTPDGNYPITLGTQDFVNWEEEQLDVKTVDGYVTVGDTTPVAPGQAQPGQFTIQAMGAKGNAGDEVEVIFNVTDNPGLVGYVFNFQYDKNALQIVNARVGDDCIDVIGSVND